MSKYRDSRNKIGFCRGSINPSAEALIRSIVFSREICNHGGSHLVYSMLDLFLNLKYVSDMLHATVVGESMMWTVLKIEVQRVE
jgi:hypothetical protein